MDEGRSKAWREAFQQAPLAMTFLFLGIVLGGGAGIWLLIAVLGFDDTPATLAGLVIVGCAIGGGLAGVFVAVFIGWLFRLLASLGRRK
jgi:hypothetical protein